MAKNMAMESNSVPLVSNMKVISKMGSAMGLLKFTSKETIDIDYRLVSGSRAGQRASTSSHWKMVP